MAKKVRAGSRSGQRNEKRQKRRNTSKLMWAWIGLGVVALAVIAVAATWPKQATLSEIPAAQAYEKYQAGAFFVDVRTQAEWDQGHIGKSHLIPLDELQNRLSEVPKDQDVVVVCRSGVRSKEGGTLLLKAGYSRVSCLSGGLQAWVAAGYPLEP